MPSPISKSTRTILIYLGFSIAVSVFVLFLTLNVLFHRAESSLVDQRFQARGPRSETADSSDIVIVEISQASFNSLPEKWPWPRSYYTHLIRNLERAGAKTIGLDVIFSTPDVRDPAADAEFKQTVRDNPNVVLAGKIETENRGYTIRSLGENYGNIFVDSTVRFGVVNIRTDADGVLRRYMPFTTDPAGRIPTFSFAVLNSFFEKPGSLTALYGDGFFHFAGRTIPCYDETSFLINYCGPSGTFRRIRFEDVIDDKDFLTVDEKKYGLETNTFDDSDYGYLNDGTFNGKIVLVGSTVPEDKDLFPVAIGQGRQEGDNQMYGAEIHANVIQNIFHGDFIIREWIWMNAAIVFGLSLFTFVYTAGLKSVKTKFSSLIEILGFVIVLSECFIIWTLSMQLFVRHNFLVEEMSPFLAVGFSYVASTVYHYLNERKQKVLIRGLFSRYVSPTVVDEIVNNPQKLRLGGERKELTVFFSDIESFTRISEKLEPENLVAILNEYLSMMTEVIFENQGTLNKYEGDAIVAFWGAPIPQLDHALRACRTAVAMQEKLAAVRPRWEAEGKPSLRVRIGISTGEMIVGNMGGVGHYDYTVIGDSVNIGARLEGANKQYRSKIIVSDSTYAQVAGYVIARELDVLIVAGRTEPIRVYELIGLANGAVARDRVDLVDCFTKGLELYRRRRWLPAIEQFETTLRHFPHDYPSQLYIERSKAYLVSPPPDDWDGAFALREK